MGGYKDFFRELLKIELTLGERLEGEKSGLLKNLEFL